MSQEKINVRFPIFGEKIPLTHSYYTYAAITNVLPEMHSPEVKWLLGPIPGKVEKNTLLLQNSFLPLRITPDKLPTLAKLAQTELRVGAHIIRLGDPSFYPIKPTESLRARIVVVRNVLNITESKEIMRMKMKESFLRKMQHNTLNITGEQVSFNEIRVERVGKYSSKIVGFSTTLQNLTPEQSVFFQSNGIGAHTHHGCGFFIP